MTVSKSVIINSKDAVLCLNRSESIEVVTRSVATLFGYTPEQLLGQPLSSILVAEQNPKVYEQTALMRNGEAPLTFQTSAIGTTDDEHSINVSATVLGISSDEKSKVAQSFVIIMRDETELLKQRAEAETAKQKSEDLLYQILPRDIVVRLNRGESDISFSVPSASITFVDIVKFSDYAAALVPAKIMASLSAVFTAFDECIAKYPLLIKIKLIGDVYMAAGGLFTPEEPPQNHAGQMIQFGLDALQALEEVNSQLDANLAVRIGVNTDGPLTAGLLGKDKPVFDIIGDPINVASRLQSTCIAGTIQISQSSYDLVARMGFSIEKRGEIDLKGKGKKMVYVVRPPDHNAFPDAHDSAIFLAPH
jgi:PAS domain S-box-containing protein